MVAWYIDMVQEIYNSYKLTMLVILCTKVSVVMSIMYYRLWSDRNKIQINQSTHFERQSLSTWPYVFSVTFGVVIVSFLYLGRRLEDLETKSVLTVQILHTGSNTNCLIAACLHHALILACYNLPAFQLRFMLYIHYDTPPLLYDTLPLSVCNLI